MYETVRKKRYRDQAEMERDAEAMAREGWYLRDWQIRAIVQEPKDEYSPMDPTMDPLLMNGPVGHGAAVGRVSWDVLQFLLLLVTWPVYLVRGRKPIEAVYERSGG